MKRAVLFTAGALALVAAGLYSRGTPAEGASVLGPLAPLAAQVQWVRGHSAARRGDTGRAFALLESATRLEPRSSAAWIALADQLGLQLASSESGRPTRERADYLRAALAVLTEGQAHVRAPARLALHRGLLLMSHAETDLDLDWPGGHAGLWRDTARAFDEAQELAATEPQRESAAAARDYAQAAAAEIESSD